jgi:anti-sigma factor RsiW
MDCEFTEEVSLLVDGELAPHEAARLRAHVEGCAACGRAREAFLLLRRELRSYDPAPDPLAQSRALAAILGPRTSEAETAARPSPPRGMAGRLSERFSEALSVSSLRPAHVATLALLLIATALGLRWLAGAHNSTGTQQRGATAVANTNVQPARATSATEAGAKRAEGSDDVNKQAVYQTKTQKPTHHAGSEPAPRVARENAQVRRDAHPAGVERREGLSPDPRQEAARVGEPTSPSSPSSAVALYTAAGLRVAAADPALRLGRHAERVERLLRSFRNARLSEGDPTLDVADARRLSKRLLYSNIALRCEAAGAGDLPAEGWLDSLEPILLDISNLPNNPSPDAVGSIKERIRRRRLVGVLQARGMLTSRP